MPNAAETADAAPFNVGAAEPAVTSTSPLAETSASAAHAITEILMVCGGSLEG